MNKMLFVSIVVSLVAGCQKEISYVGQPDGNNPNPNPVTTVLQGNIMDENDQPAAGVVVKAGNKATSTNAHGYFRITNAHLDKIASLITAEKAGYFTAYRSFQATSGANYAKIKLVKKISAGTINSAAGGNVTLLNGSKIALPANAIVKVSGGSAYNGTIKVYAAYIDPTANDISQTVPGSFMADDKNNKRVALVSYGMLAVELESTNGEKLQIAPGSVATLTTPIPSSLQASAPASISLWYVNEQTGLWKEEGTAVKNGNNYVGDVKHFSFWNCDAGFPGINLAFTLKNSEGIPVSYSLVMLRRPGNAGESCGWTDSLGQVSGLVPVNETMILQLVDPCYNTIYTQNVGPFSQNTNLGVITVPNPGTASLVTIRGQLKNCNNAPVTHGYALINYNNVTEYASVNSAGEFSLSFTRCLSSGTTFEILGVDAATSQQGNSTPVTITTPVTNTGDITACGVAANQYINYTIDGTTYSITSAITDSIVAETYPTQTTPPLETFIEGSNPPGYIRLEFKHNPAAGIYSLLDFSVSGYDDSLATIEIPFIVTLAKYAASPGDFYEGTFTGKFNEGYPVFMIHTLTGSFRVRRR